MRHIHAILSENENDAANKFISDHVLCGGDIEHIFYNTREKATFRVRCSECGVEKDLTDFNPASERGLLQTYQNFLDFSDEMGFERVNTSKLGLVIVLGKSAIESGDTK